MKPINTAPPIVRNVRLVLNIFLVSLLKSPYSKSCMNGEINMNNFEIKKRDEIYTLELPPTLTLLFAQKYLILVSTFGKSSSKLVKKTKSYKMYFVIGYSTNKWTKKQSPK